MAACKHGTVRCMSIPAGICVGGAQNARNDAAPKTNRSASRSVDQQPAEATGASKQRETAAFVKNSMG